MTHINGLKETVNRYQSLRNLLDDLQALWELASEAEDESLLPELKSQQRNLEKQLEKLELEVLLSGEYDNHAAILSLHAGAGGVEAQDWAQMLLRMYMRYCESRGFKVELMDSLPGEEAGIKSATLSVEGLNAPPACRHFPCGERAAFEAPGSRRPPPRWACTARRRG